MSLSRDLQTNALQGSCSSFFTIPTVPMDIKTKTGSDNTISFYYLTSSTTQYGKVLEAAYSMPLGTPEIDSYILQANQAQETLLAKKMPSDFNHVYFYRDSNGIRMAEKADCDLMEFIESENYSLSDAKNMIAQLLLAIEDYQSRDLSHNDICEANVLVFKRAGKIFIKLSDQDHLTILSDTPLENEDAENYQTQDIRFLTQSCLSALIDPFIDVEDKDIESHLEFAENIIDDFAAGKSISQVKTSRWFGETQEERQAYFLKLREEAKLYNTLHIDGYAVTQTAPIDNDFFIYPKLMKPFYIWNANIDATFARFYSQIDKLDKVLDRITLQVSTVKSTFFTSNKRRKLDSDSVSLAHIEPTAREAFRKSSHK